MTYATPKIDGNGDFKGDLRPLGRRSTPPGGWWDAGDYLKFVETRATPARVLLLGVRDFPRQMAQPRRRPIHADEARFGVDWLLRMWDDAHAARSTTRSGSATATTATVGDHDIWRLPQADDTYGGSDPLYRYIRNRPVFRAGPPGSPVSPNLAGRDAAAFALCFQVFRTRQPGLAARCLRVGRAHLRARRHVDPRRPADGHPVRLLPRDRVARRPRARRHRARPRARWPARRPPGCRTPMPRCTLRTAARWARAYIDGPTTRMTPLNLYDVSGLAHYELVQGDRRAGRSVGPRRDARRPRDRPRQAARPGARAAAQDPFGFGVPWDTGTRRRTAFGLSVVASEYDQLTGTTRSQRESSRWLGERARRERVGPVADHRRRHHVPPLPAAPGREPGGLARRVAAVLLGAAVEGPSDAATTGRLAHMRRCPARSGTHSPASTGRRCSATTSSPTRPSSPPST